MEVKYTNKTPTKNKRKKKKAKKVFIILLVLMALALVGILLLQTVLFPIENITIKNAENTIYTTDEILNASGVNKGDKLFAVKESKLNEILAEKLPYIKEVEISRKLPSSITITVLPEKSVYSFNQNGKYIVLSENYKILEKTVERKENTIAVTGVNIANNEIGKYISFNDDKTKELFLSLVEYITKYGIVLTGVDVTTQTQLQVVINEKITANLGSITDIEYKVQYLQTMLKNIDINVKGRIDLSDWSSANPKGYYAKEENQ